MEDQIRIRSELSSRIRTSASAKLESRIRQWGDPSELKDRICVYTTGSFGRGDASRFSDLDVFIVCLHEPVTNSRMLNNLEQIELLASIVHVNRELNLPKLDGDGGFLKVHSLDEYLVGLGKPSDDANNTFTGRLLLLLESQVIFGNPAYEHVRRECVMRYWLDYADHSDSFLPAFLVNDILRFWRTLCINYEAGSSISPAKRRAKNYKLKYSRLLTCFSAIVAIQAEFQKNGTVSDKQAIMVLEMSPLDRLRHVKQTMGGKASDLVITLFEMYGAFLSETDCSKEDLYRKMEDVDYYRQSLRDARLFGDTVFRLIQEISATKDGSPAGLQFLRYITI
jgi:hypothetical protein